ncbi:MAG TPA: hypothetical protein PLL06_15880 [Acidobacteriota bacterium]|nr:hypothetical protein [Acidobacteriota bacterium]HMZ81182.1 hypothetical protein [Acidobacteriota bacterium]HND21862.1 hypothetical protein [Acidobacteriota bacterium]
MVKTEFRIICCILLMSLLIPVIGCQDSAPQVVVPAANRAARDGAAKSQMRTIYRAEEAFKARTGRYGTMAELVEGGELNTDPENERLYKYTLTASENTFECVGMPVVYNVNGTVSYYIDQTGQLRGSDRKGQPASSSDPVVAQ